MARIRFEGVTVDFDGFRALDGIDLTIEERLVGIIGSNGSGKSTLARLINGLNEPSSGTVTVDGLDVVKDGKKVRRRVGFIFSDAENQIVMPRVVDDVAFSLRTRGVPRAEREPLAMRALERLGLEEHAESSPHLLSGGQKQLLALAAVLVTEPDVIVADEPTALLDLANTLKITALFHSLPQQIVVVTHDLDVLSDFERVIRVDNAHIVDDGKPARVIAGYRETMLRSAR
ncbi:energy-coupling factor ABC transporter ATP-binding protein [Corynebacterium otitidis]|uniref:energy-coupling factor ABC transporter ATP-binding protein n=1 Tax=Corynebacterium otitidis TaxID=29321 RepID=UPI00062795C9|nr:ABC transporter ATP-binding protein [Corynebacterium otitidis]KKO83936.1 cobalt ABC transporter ATP-binding protein [Corynebacterium otitidis]